MFEEMPRTPFSTHLSGSAREAEIRLRNIFSGPKKRPPIPFLILIFSICLFCGNLVSCHVRPAQPTVVMETQYYDRYANYVEIPALALPAGEENQAVEAINAALNGLREEYAFAQDSVRGGNMCLFYPSTTDRYLNLVFFLNENSYGHDGWVRSWVYDKEEGGQVTAEDALSLAGTTREALCGGLEELIANDPEYPRGMYEPADIVGFRIKADGQPVFYLSAFVDYVELESGGALDEWYRLYVWEGGEYIRYDCMVFGDSSQYPLVPAEETDKLDPPLWNQWYFAGEEPSGGFSPAPVSSRSAADLRSVLLGSMMFTDAEEGLVLDISRVTEAVTSSPDFTAYPARFAYMDMDGDGINEAVLWLETEDGDPVLAFIVLRWQGDGRVFGYTRFPRSFQGLKQDGTFSFSSSAADYGVGKLIFTAAGEGAPDECTTWDLALQERIDSDWDNLAWYVDGGPAAQGEFDDAWEEYFAKQDAVWHDFTLDTIERIVF